MTETPFDYSALRNTRSDEDPAAIATAAWADLQHRDNVGGQHRPGFCQPCADAHQVAQGIYYGESLTSRDRRLLEHASRFDFAIWPDGHPRMRGTEGRVVRVVRRGGDRWAVVEHTDCFDRNGDRDVDQSGRGRDEQYMARFWFGLDEAVHIAENVIAPMLRAEYEHNWQIRQEAGS
jgi:hypothetical protein